MSMSMVVGVWMYQGRRTVGYREGTYAAPEDDVAVGGTACAAGELFVSG